MSGSGTLFTQTLVLLAGEVIAAPLFRLLGLGTILGYLAAGVVIGLELKPSRLWQIRADVFGLCPAQIILNGLAVMGLSMAAGLTDWRGSLVIGFGLSLSSTAFAIQILNDQDKAPEA